MGVPNTETTAIQGTITRQLPDGAFNLAKIRYASDDMATIASAGSTIATGTAIATNQHLSYVTGANGTAGVTLPAMNNGETYMVGNASASNLNVWPNSSSIQINAATAGNPYVISANQGESFTGFSASQIVAS